MRFDRGQKLRLASACAGLLAGAVLFVMIVEWHRGSRRVEDILMVVTLLLIGVGLSALISYVGRDVSK
jgi:hypothetical protein